MPGATCGEANELAPIVASTNAAARVTIGTGFITAIITLLAMHMAV